jgi:EAL and modified HD-GYP domain-containing signal transduction protein
MDSNLTQTAPAQPRAEQEPHGEMRYVARHPILNLMGRVHGYELLFRRSPELGYGGDSKLATRTILDDTLIFGIDKLTGGLPAFVNCTAESILEQLVEVMPPSMTVIEIDAAVDFSIHLLAACRRLKAIGYHLALDGFVWETRIEPLTEIADYVKVDFLKTRTAERKELLLRFRNSPAAMIATKVETEAEYRKAKEEGFTLFQGFYFCHPELLSNAKVPANRLIHFQILQCLYRDPLDLQRIGKLVKFDAALTYRLLRLVNSSAYAIRQEISSIESAIMVIGESIFRRIATVAILSELNAGKPPEILRMAFVRARFCELAAPLCGLAPDEQYLLGMLSLLHAMLRLPMEALVAQLPLRHEIRQALLGTANAERWLLRWLESYERGEWEEVDALVQASTLRQQQLIQCYTEAVAWDGGAPEAAG